VIDALNESGDTTSRIGLHTFLTGNLKRLPLNFHMVITSRPEHAIVSALAGALPAETHGDIFTFFSKDSSNEFGDYVEALAKIASTIFCSPVQITMDKTCWTINTKKSWKGTSQMKKRRFYSTLLLDK